MAEWGIRGEAAQEGGVGGGVGAGHGEFAPGGGQQASGVADIGAEGGEAGTHGFEQAHGHLFGDGRHDEGVEDAVGGCGIGGISGENDLRFEAAGADGFADFGFGGSGADEDEAGIGDVRFGEAVDEPGEVLLAAEAGDSTEDRGVGRDAEGGAEFEVAGGAEAVDINAVGDLQQMAGREAVVGVGNAEKRPGGDDHAAGSAGEDEAACPEAAALQAG